LELAKLVVADDSAAIAKLGDIGPKWAAEIIRRFRALEHLHRLEVTSQPPAPVIKVLTKTKPQKQIPIS
jgi:predicted ATPase